MPEIAARRNLSARWRMTSGPTSAIVPDRVTVPLTLLFAFGAGAVLAVASRRALRRAPEPMRTRYALVAVILFLSARAVRRSF